MLKELFTAALGMQNQQTRLEVTANNIANSSTAGFKRASVFERNLIDARANFYNTPGDVEQNDPPVGSYYDLQNGAMQQTDNPLDIALENKGFFLLEDGEGKQFLSRAGNFRLSEDGTIIAMDGKKLMGENGPISIGNEFLQSPQITNDDKAINLRIALNGEVYANDSEIGKIMVVEVNNPESLQRISNSDFIATWTTQPNYVESEQVRIRQGWIESSNVDIVGEMVEMIELQRMFEAGSKVIETNNGTLDESIAMGRYY
jgi:flagellar basal body rod protein FlgG